MTEEPSLLAEDQAGGAKPPSPAAPVAYRVLARKYRPSSFEDLIGQEAMVRTLSNAFDLGRIHQAYILTGVRGVGKTTTARILARAFNYEVPAHDGHPAIDKPTIHMPELGVHCAAIIESRHVDVVEMDAASHTGIDDVREIIESARYRPIMARTKVFIIDEVHMLSKPAFNGLLKTLEEPPDHVRFLFATTEIEKVPVTVRSRCQRFDLRRVDAEVLIRYLATICAREQIEVDAEALTLIARASEGSVRDALSLLDQAIAYGSSSAGRAISGESVRAMLGVADRGRIIDMFEALMKGDVAAALAILADQYDQGADPANVLSDLAEFVHFVTRLKIIPDARLDAAVTQDERVRGESFAKGLGLAVLTRAWQLLAKGVQDVKDSPRPLAAADMVLVRIAYAADLPTPDDLVRRLTNNQSQGDTPPSGRGGASATALAPASSASHPALVSSGGAARQPLAARPNAAPQAAAPRVRLARFEEIVTLAQVNRDIQLKVALERDVRLVRFAEGSIEFSLVEGASPQIVASLMRRLQEWTGMRWMVTLSSEPGAATLKEVADAREKEKLVGIAADPLVRRVLERFPGAEIVAVRSAETVVQPVPDVAEQQEQSDEIAYADEIYTEDDL